MGFFSAGAGPVPNMADLSKDDSKAKYVMTLLRFFFFLFLERKGEIPRFWETCVDLYLKTITIKNNVLFDPSFRGKISINNISTARWKCFRGFDERRKWNYKLVEMGNGWLIGI